MMRVTGNHAEAAILRAIIAEATGALHDRENPVMIVESIASADWASATFVGSTHEITIRLKGTAVAIMACVARMVDKLPERDIPIAGRIVADIAIDAGEQVNMADNIVAITLTVNALTIID